MQAVSTEFADYVQAPGTKQFLIKAEVWSADESELLLQLDDVEWNSDSLAPVKATARSCAIAVDRAAECRRTCTLVVNNERGWLSPDDAAPADWPFAENNVLKVWTGYRLPSGVDELLPVFWGLLDPAAVPVDASSESAITVVARSVEKRLAQEKFGDTTVYVDNPSESANYALPAQGGSATASSSLAAGQPLQPGARVTARAYATVLGQMRAVAAPASCRLAVDGSTDTTLEHSYAATGLTTLELVLFVDLRCVESVQSLTPRLGEGTTATSLRTSSDGLTWTERDPGGMGAASFRFAELTVEVSAAGGQATVVVQEVEVLAGAAYAAANAIDGDSATTWRPAPGDLDRAITIAFGTARTFNALYLSWGATLVDQDNPVTYQVLNGDTGAVLVDQAEPVCGLVEHVVAGSCSSITVRVLTAAGLVALRHVEVLQVTATNTVSYLLGDLAAQAGIARRDVQPSRLYRANLTCQLGESYIQHARDIAAAAAWDLYGDPEGYLVARPARVNPTDVAARYEAGAANIIGGFTREPGQQAIFNHVVVLAKLLTQTIRGDAKDDAAGSPTSTQRLGDRVLVVEDPGCDTQKKADARALVELWRNCQWRSAVSFSAVANPAHEAGDVLEVVEGTTRVAGLYVLESFELSMTPAEFSMSLRCAPLGV